MSQTLLSTEHAATAQAPGQWRLAEVQMANWGTFDGRIYRIPIARQGHLVTGPSGSGKSSLLDAIAAVLTPDKWLRFNAAAQGGRTRAGQRSLVSYVRGAWMPTIDELEDRIVSAYLRPGATWSGIVLRYENDVDRPVSLGRLFFLRGAAMSTTEIHDLCLLDRSALDLRDLEPFARGGIETRKVKAAWPDAVVTSGGNHRKFYARLRTVFGIENEGALQLLHKTQSAKSLDSLDQLFRDYMLEQPATFDLARTAVDQFGELRDAHEHVVRLREQRDHLLALRDASTAYDTASEVAGAAHELAQAVVPYQKHRSLQLARGEQQEAAERLIGLDADLERLRGAASRAEEEHSRAQLRALELGGGEAQSLQRQIEDARRTAQATADRWERLRRQLAAGGIDSTPRTAAEFAELLAQIDRQLSEPSTGSGPTYDEQARLHAARDAKKRIDDDIESLRISGTTIPHALLSVRAEIAAAVNLPVTALPFAAEIIEVKPEFGEWTGAIERVLRPFALTMLVRSEHLSAVRRWVDVHRIGTRFVYEELTGDPGPPRPAASPLSLVNRISITSGSFADWVTATVSQRFDYACVDTADELDDHQRAVTLAGQIKTSRTRYEKNDRIRIDDRAHWVLGDRDAKLEALISRLRDADAELAAARQTVERAERRRSEELRREGTLQAVREQTWADVDRQAADATLAALEEQLTALTREDSGLDAAFAAQQRARRALDAISDELRNTEFAHREATGHRTGLVTAIEELEAQIASGAVPPVPDDTATALDTRFRRIQRSITRASIAEVGQQVFLRLQTERDGALEGVRTAGNDIVRLATEFNTQWPAAAADLTPAITDRRGYLDMLDGIIAHGLPEHEATFLRLLRERSRDLIGELVSDILDAPRDIEERIRPVNTSLRRSRFDADRWLRLRVKTRRSETVTRFIADLRSISEGSWNDEDLAAAEQRFATLADIMRRFGSSDHIDQTWRTQCLDTRLHVTFLAEEIDEHERAHATYDSGTAMSGGQQQKLVVFCLAAALRYQLADPDDDLPTYGTIVFDEAFDKADTRYTRMALDVFVEFGFQLVLATPQKLLQTIEPYVGAATEVDNPTRRRSVISAVTWREAPEIEETRTEPGA